MQAAKVWAKKTGHVQKLATNKKSTIFVQSLWNLVKMITSWGNYFHQLPWGWAKNADFSSMAKFWIFFYSYLNNRTNRFQRCFIQCSNVKDFSISIKEIWISCQMNMGLPFAPLCHGWFLATKYVPKAYRRPCKYHKWHWAWKPS